MTPETQTINEKVDKMNSIKMCASKDTIKRVKRQQIGRIVENHLPSKSVVPRTYTEFLQLGNQKIIAQFRNG